jgi:competence protein ComFC
MPHRFFNFLLDLLFPWQCLNCNQETDTNYPLCSACLEKIPIFDDFINNTPPLEFLGIVSSYQNPVLKEIIHRFKYNKIKELYLPLSSLVIKFLEQSHFFQQLPENDVLLIPLPLHAKKLKQRGFNQSELIAKQIADYFHLSLGDNLIRIRNNPPQANIQNRSLRKTNVKNIFQIQNPQVIKDKVIILIDDVYTTGATLEEAALTLQKAKVKEVIGLVIAQG